ncbi:MAG: hypothetical protein M1828_002085 [Chrysothrix sp. TS-e1954]|nr:MAG: hypothetical protein M1828_002085 [Chrysothrix sp. TS-e1954]
MDLSTSLLSAQVHFLDTKLSLVHIPLHLYSSFVQPILQLLLPPESSSSEATQDSASGSEAVRARRPWTYEHPFVNVSVTPVECSVVCSSHLAQQLFAPVRDSLNDVSKAQVSISSEEYVVIQVDGEGLEAGQRVLELTSPLAMKGIPIFFITTYFSDYILFPLRSRKAVIAALEARGFAFSAHDEAFVNISSPVLRSHSASTTSQPTTGTSHSRQSSSVSSRRHTRSSDTGIQSADDLPSVRTGSDSQAAVAPPTPPPSSVHELEARTFALLARRSIAPVVDPSLRLVQTAGRKDTLRGGTGAHASSAPALLKLQLGLIKSLVMVPRPRFISVTLTDTEPASILLERELLANFGEKGGEDESFNSILLGNREEALVPIMLDLRDLPMESTGIVCGVAGRLVGGTATNTSAVFEPLTPGSLDDPTGSIEMSYLSTARAGTVMVSEAELERALEALRGRSAMTSSKVHGDTAEIMESIGGLNIRRNPR